MATNDDDSEPPPDDGKTTLTVNIGSGYLGVCSAFHEGVKPLTVKIFVDVVENGQVVSTYSDYIFNVTNADGLGNESNYIFDDIEVPESGTFSIYVSSLGNTCYTCCPQGIDCVFGSGGNPTFTGATAIINADNVDGETILVDLILESCA